MKNQRNILVKSQKKIFQNIGKQKAIYMQEANRTPDRQDQKTPYSISLLKNTECTQRQYTESCTKERTNIK